MSNTWDQSWSPHPDPPQAGPPRDVWGGSWGVTVRAAPVKTAGLVGRRDTAPALEGARPDADIIGYEEDAPALSGSTQ